MKRQNLLLIVAAAVVNVLAFQNAVTKPGLEQTRDGCERVKHRQVSQLLSTCSLILNASVAFFKPGELSFSEVSPKPQTPAEGMLRPVHFHVHSIYYTAESV